MPIRAIDVRSGQAIIWRDVIWIVQDNHKVAKGKGRAFQSIRLKNLQTGQVLEERFRTEEGFELAIIERKLVNYLYSEADAHVFMDMETYEEVRVPADLVGEESVYLTPNFQVTLGRMDGKPVTLELPFTVELVVEDTPPFLKGAAATNQMKEARCEGGAKVKVPPFVENGTHIKVDTRTGEYLERA